MSGANDICDITDLDVPVCWHCNRKKPKYTVPPRTSGMFDGVPEAVYHGDRESLSSSGARKLLRVPALFKHELDNGPEYRDEFDFGSVAHKYVLGEGSDVVVVCLDSWRTKKAQAMRAEAREAHKIPILERDNDIAQEMAAVVRIHPRAAALLADGMAEQSLYWTDPVAWVRCRARPDWITELDGDLIIGDYKTTKCAEPWSFARSAANYGYHQQAAWYLTAVRALEIAPTPRFWFIAQEKVAPYLVSVHEYDARDLATGARLNRRAIDLYARCMATGVWPAYGDQVHRMRLPRWARSAPTTDSTYRLGEAA